MTNRTLLGALALVVAISSTAPAQTIKVDPRIQPYQKVSGISGSASSIGSDTMNNLMALWLEGFRKYYPNVRIQIEGKGSSTAPPALIEGTAQFGPMSRAMKSTELDKFEEKFGYPPTALRTSLDALAVFVNKDNPVEGLTLPQVDAIFSKTRRGGHTESVDRWGDLGLTGDWASSRLSLYGRNSASGTYGFFKSVALFKGDYRDEVKEQPGSASVVQGVTEDRFGVGYSGIGYRTSGVRIVPLAEKKGLPFKEATLENVLDGSYPLGRFLFLYVNKAPGQPLDPLIREFCRFVFSKEGQEIVIKDGYMPVPYEVVVEELAALAEGSE
jgi:phosphate transport system substrate-binding protein